MSAAPEHRPPEEPRDPAPSHAAKSPAAAVRPTPPSVEVDRNSERNSELDLTVERIDTTGALKEGFAGQEM